KFTTFEPLIRQSLRGNGDRFGIAFQPLLIGANLGGVLVSKVKILFQTLIDDALKFDWQVRVQTYCRGWCPIQSGFEEYPGTFSTKRKRTGRHLVEHGSKREEVGSGV